MSRGRAKIYCESYCVFGASFLHVCVVFSFFFFWCGFPFEWMDLVCVCMWQSIRWHWTLTRKPEPPNEMTVFFDIFPPLSLNVFLLIFWPFLTKEWVFFSQGVLHKNKRSRVKKKSWVNSEKEKEEDGRKKRKKKEKNKIKDLIWVDLISCVPYTYAYAYGIIWYAYMWCDEIHYFMKNEEINNIQIAMMLF